MSNGQVNFSLGITSEDQKEFPVNLLDQAEINSFLNNYPAEKESKTSPTIRFLPDDQVRPWRDFRVQNAARRFLREVVLPDWVQNHPHGSCSNIRVDEWGRLLCRYITPTGPVDGPWENPTHFLFYAYNRFQVQQYYGITLNAFLRDFCNVEGSLPS